MASSWAAMPIRVVSKTATGGTSNISRGELMRLAELQLMLLVFSMPLHAQQSISLSVGTLGPEFKSVAAVRELADGRTLVIDSDERALFVVDWSTLQRRPVGRTGNGPGEYQYPGQLVALGADSTLLIDFQNGKWHFLNRDRFTMSLQRDDSTVSWFACGSMVGADSMGRLLALRGTRYPEQYQRVRCGSAVAESLVVIRVSRRAAVRDTIAHLRGPFTGESVFRGRTATGKMVYILTNPLSAGDQALLFPDGWTAIVIATPYHVVWHPPRGAVIKGQPLPFAQQRVDDRVKRQAVDDRWPPSPHIPKFQTSDFPAWPTVVPPFLEKALLALPDGRIAIKRVSFEAGRKNQYDIVDRRGVLSAVLHLPRNERLIGSGKQFVYVAVTDVDDVQYLRRHSWP